jgi:predicted DNA-binding transcriptional regulator AlpA
MPATQAEMARKAAALKEQNAKPQHLSKPQTSIRPKANKRKRPQSAAGRNADRGDGDGDGDSQMAGAQRARSQKLPRFISADDVLDPKHVLLSKEQMLAIVPLGYPHIWKLMSEERFPRSRAIGGRSVWIKAEIYEWISRLPVRRLKGDAEKVA